MASTSETDLPAAVARTWEAAVRSPVWAVVKAVVQTEDQEGEFFLSGEGEKEKGRRKKGERRERSSEEEEEV